MTRGYSSYHRKQPFDQSRSENIERDRLAGQERRIGAEVASKQNLKAAAERRAQLLKNYNKGDMVSDGKYTGRVSKVDAARGVLVVSLIPSGKEVRWAPDFVTKVG